jgi:hypothetical protein
MNLLEETLEMLKELKKTGKDVIWVGSSDGQYAISWEEFVKIASVEYDNGFGAQEIASDLIIVFNDGTWLSRGEYDGSEWWEFHKLPQKQPSTKTFTVVKVRGEQVGWKTINDLNQSRE